MLSIDTVLCSWSLQFILCNWDCMTVVLSFIIYPLLLASFLWFCVLLSFWWLIISFFKNAIFTSTLIILNTCSAITLRSLYSFPFILGNSSPTRWFFFWLTFKVLLMRLGILVCMSGGISFLCALVICVCFFIPRGSPGVPNPELSLKSYW